MKYSANKVAMSKSGRLSYHGRRSPESPELLTGRRTRSVVSTGIITALRKLGDDGVLPAVWYRCERSFQYGDLFENRREKQNKRGAGITEPRGLQAAYRFLCSQQHSILIDFRVPDHVPDQEIARIVLKNASLTIRLEELRGLPKEFVSFVWINMM
jgi:hypothetical protein